MFIFAKESKKGVKIFVPKKKFFEKKVTRGSLKDLSFYFVFSLDEAVFEIKIDRKTLSDWLSPVRFHCNLVSEMKRPFFEFETDWVFPRVDLRWRSESWECIVWICRKIWRANDSFFFKFADWSDLRDEIRFHVHIFFVFFWTAGWFCVIIRVINYYRCLII